MSGCAQWPVRLTGGIGKKVKQARDNTSNCTRRTDKDGEATCEYVVVMPKAAEEKGEEKW